MRVIRIKTENNCSMPLCNRQADYVITSTSGRGNPIYICEKCKTKLYEELAKYTIPKSIENVIVRANRRREINE